MFWSCWGVLPAAPFVLLACNNHTSSPVAQANHRCRLIPTDPLSPGKSGDTILDYGIALSTILFCYGMYASEAPQPAKILIKFSALPNLWLVFC